jgi:hypothetical protein
MLSDLEGAISFLERLWKWLGLPWLFVMLGLAVWIGSQPVRIPWPAAVFWALSGVSVGLGLVLILCVCSLRILRAEQRRRSAITAGRENDARQITTADAARRPADNDTLQAFLQICNPCIAAVNVASRFYRDVVFHYGKRGPASKDWGRDDALLIVVLKYVIEPCERTNVRLKEMTSSTDRPTVDDMQHWIETMSELMSQFKGVLEYVYRAGVAVASRDRVLGEPMYKFLYAAHREAVLAVQRIRYRTDLGELPRGLDGCSELYPPIEAAEE